MHIDSLLRATLFPEPPSIQASHLASYHECNQPRLKHYSSTTNLSSALPHMFMLCPTYPNQLRRLLILRPANQPSIYFA